MAVTETRIEAPLADVEPLPPPSGLAGWLSSADHKVIGRLYIVGALLFLLASAVTAELVSLERVDTSGIDILSKDAFAQIYTFHSISAVFGFLLPLILGVAIVVVPLQVGSPTIAFPRAAAASFWTYLVSGGIVCASYAINGGPYGGDRNGVDLFTLAFAIMVLALLVGVMCVVTTVFTLRPAGLGLDRVPLFSWSMVVAGVVWLLTLPALLAVLLLVWVDHGHGRVLLGGNNGIYPHILWSLLQPCVFAYAIPGLGVIADIIPVFSRARHSMHRLAMVAIGMFGAFSIGAWVQPMFIEKGTNVYAKAPFVALGVLMIAPTMLLVALWADTIRRGRFRLGSPVLLAVTAILAYVAAAVTGALAVIRPLDLWTTTWETAQGHLTLLAVTVALIGGIHYWSPKLFGRLLAEGLGRVTALLALAGVALLTVPDLISGVLDQPMGRDLSANAGAVRDGVEALNVVAAIGGVIVILAAAAFLVNLIGAVARRSDDVVADDPWEGHTLEWATASPPPPGNFTTLPELTSEAPLLDARETTEATA
jgi:heme/copper-type cytochrome/quinol oxidase subunit 1